MDKFVQITEDILTNEDYNVRDYLIEKVDLFYFASICDIECIINEKLLDCESPIEQLFMICWINNVSSDINTPYLTSICEVQQHELTLDNIDMRIDFYMEHHLKNFNGESKLLKIAVEFDGHEFHKSTKEQVSKDNQRDMILQKHDIHVLRFSGSDIWANPYQQVKKLSDFIWTKHYQFLGGG